MATFPGIYRAKASSRVGATLIAFVPQVFGEHSITIKDFVGAAPSTAEMGWVGFQGGNPEFPVWFGATAAAGNGDTWTLEDGAVTTTKLGDGAVTAAKLGDGAATNTKLGALSVTTSKIANNAVSTRTILDANVTAAKMSQSYTEGWLSWTPILSVWALSNGTLTGSYCQTNDTVYFVFKLTIGSGTTFGTGPIIGGFPVPIHADFFESHFPLGIYCSGLNSTGVGRFANDSQITLDTYSTKSGTNPVQLGVGGISGTVPGSFVAGSRVIGTGFYKAA